jgi:hypothetical protein
MSRSLNDDATVERFRTALDLFETGQAMMRHRIRRQNPALAEVEVDARLQAWLQARPGAEHGDTVGRPVPWPRSRRP